jgi:hypothetical protein
MDTRRRWEVPKYEVVNEKTTYYSIEIEAASAEEAFEIAKNTDISEFAENNTEWYQNEAELIED